MSEKSVEGIKKINLSMKNFLQSINFLTAMRFFFINIILKPNMNKYFRTTKLLRKLVVSTPLISLSLTDSTKYAKVCLRETTSLSVVHILSIRPYKKLLAMKTTTKTGNNQKFSRKVRDEKVEAT